MFSPRRTVRVEWGDCDAVATICNSRFDIADRVATDAALAIEASETRVGSGPHPDAPRRLKARPLPEIMRRRLCETGHG